MTARAPLYARVMGDSWTRLAEPVRCLHATQPMIRARGSMRVEQGRHRVARLLAWLLRLPRPAAEAQTRLIVTGRTGGEHWDRTFDGGRLETWQYQSNQSELAERFGVLEFRFRLDASDGSLLYVHRRTALRLGLLRLGIPASCAPRIAAREDPAGPERVRVQVRVTLPGIGLLIAYDGVVFVEDPRT